MTQQPHSTTPKFTNRLAHEASLYLRQHAHQPVDWYPWGPDAFEQARRERKPIFISIGYSACHWCHVMAHESFDNEEIARFLNEHFVSVKVDREERPDVDAVYMNVCVALNGSGGWPLTVITTPSLHPIFAGTYFPPYDRAGRIGFRTLLERVIALWKNDAEGLEKQAVVMTRELQRLLTQDPPSVSSGEPVHEILVRAAEERFDWQFGGFGHAPKFPPDTLLRSLLAVGITYADARVLAMVEKTLDAMLHGGLYDQLEGGFSRYCVDEDWTVPHFEKMLYTQALLIPLYADASVVFNRQEFLQAALESADWVLSKMHAPTGGFHAALDADSEGQEGKYYVWTYSDLAAVLGERLAEFALAYFDIPRTGNFEHGASVLRRADNLSTLAERFGLSHDETKKMIDDIRAKLRLARELRVAPATDDKVILSWNSLMISALVRLAHVSRQERYLDVAAVTAQQLWAYLRPNRGQLYRVLVSGEAKTPAVLEDYAFFIRALIDLYEHTLDTCYLAQAQELAGEAVQKFYDPQSGRLYSARSDDPNLILTLQDDFHDSALPSPAISLVTSLLRLDLITGNNHWRSVHVPVAERILRTFHNSPLSVPSALELEDFRTSPVVCSLSGTMAEASLRELHAVLMRASVPARVVRVDADQDGDSSRHHVPATYAGLQICVGDRCLAPVKTAEELHNLLQRERLGVI